MGNIQGSLSLSIHNYQDINLSDYTLSQERNDERFGHIYVMKSKIANKTVLIKERQPNFQKENIDEVTKRLELSNDYLLKIFDIKKLADTNTYQILFEDFNTDLDKEIRRHLNEKTRFHEGELYAILYCTVSALSALENNKLAHDFVVPSNLLKISREVYKTHDNYILQQKQTIYSHALKGQYVRYLAPELFESFAQKKETPAFHDHCKADIYALGVCLLDAGLLNLEGDFVNKKLNVFDELRLKEKLKIFSEKYSRPMTRILEDMLCLDPSRRPSPSLLLKRLPGRPVSKSSKESSAKKSFIKDYSLQSSPYVIHFLFY